MRPVCWAGLLTLSLSALAVRVSLMRMVFCAADTGGAAKSPRTHAARNTFIEEAFSSGYRWPATEAVDGKIAMFGICTASCCAD
ncbi:MAG: hypothetical protein DMD54_00780 [Gemmatimonadetes bacterium]|nr:MAG: hypothetical protein DMD54_00780 [Gemmatimonadota bacterium]